MIPQLLHGGVLDHGKPRASGDDPKLKSGTGERTV